jgi:WD40 repeat protein
MTKTKAKRLRIASCGIAFAAAIFGGYLAFRPKWVIEGEVALTSVMLTSASEHVPTSTRLRLDPDGAISVIRESGVAVTSYRRHRAQVTAAEFSPAADMVVSADRSGEVHIWSTSDGLPRLTIAEPYAVNFVNVAPDARLFLTAGDADFATVRDLATGRAVHRLEGHRDRLFSASFEPTGDRILTGSWDGTARLWRASTGAISEVLSIPTGPPAIARFTSQPGTIVLASLNHPAVIWRERSTLGLARGAGRVELWIIVASLLGIALAWSIRRGAGVD